MTSLPSLLISFAVIGAVLTFLTYRARLVRNLLWTFLQHFCGVWFVFSGLVKADDPIGTAYKMEDYFAQFEQTFAGLSAPFNALAPMFPWLAAYALGFSIFMVVLEIVLGVMLILGTHRKLTSWLFFIILLFFTLLTGFTFLTGFVPPEANFFEFGKWGPYIKTQMRVTDCGCFGDFIKLDPRISFYKDVFLLLPGLLFLVKPSWMHQLTTAKRRSSLTLLTVAVSWAICIYAAYLNLPPVDFRPFKIGTNIRERKALEAEARGNVEITGWIFENTNTGQVVTVMEPDYKTATANYPKDQGWKVKDRVQSEPFIEKDGKRIPITESKVSDFSIEDPVEGRDVTDDILNEQGYSLMIIAYKLKGENQLQTIAVQDTVWTQDTVRVNADSFTVQNRFVSVTPRSEERSVFVPDQAYAQRFRTEINPLAEAAKQAGWKVYCLATVTDGEKIDDFKRQIEAPYPFYRGDDKLLKTIIRANPGVVVLKDGQVLAMYHHRHLPTFDQIRK